MEKNTIILIALAFIVFGLILESVQINALSGKVTGNTVNAASPGGETIEQMNARMHPDQVASTQGTNSQSNMVGGC